MQFKLDVMKTLDADNAFSWQSTSRLLHSRPQIPWNQRKITAENLRLAGNRYKTLEFIVHIIDRALKQKNQKTPNKIIIIIKNHKKAFICHSGNLKKSYDCKCNLYLNFFLTLKMLQRIFSPGPFQWNSSKYQFQLSQGSRAEAGLTSPIPSTTHFHY